MASRRRTPKARRTWRPRVLWRRKPQTQVVPNRRRPSRQDVKRWAQQEQQDSSEAHEEEHGWGEGV